MKSVAVVSGLLLLLLVVVVRCSTDTRPVIGVVSQARDWRWPDSLPPAYIASSYVKYLESSGARVAFVDHRLASNRSYLDQQFSSLSGVLFPGGAQNLENASDVGAAQLLAISAYFVQRSVEVFQSSGVVFPVLGHCLGFELIVSAAAGVPRSQCMTRALPAKNVALPLQFVGTPSRWFSPMSNDSIVALSKRNCSFNMHRWSISPDMWSKSALAKDYRINALSDNGLGDFVSAFEHRTAPVFAMQFHAEKPMYEWSEKERIPHTAECVSAMASFAEFITLLARKSNNVFLDDSALIYNTAPTRSITFSSFEQLYFFE